MCFWVDYVTRALCSALVPPVDFSFDSHPGKRANKPVAILSLPITVLVPCIELVRLEGFGKNFIGNRPARVMKSLVVAAFLMNLVLKVFAHLVLALILAHLALQFCQTLVH